ncbi:MAG: dTDP-4-dehydrorhamnose reductase [Methanobacteriaceae archaeon]|jgi:dTDP-4-dehydrorhamnose reductase|nr:dTDP-4-dehydrorhamnose reductase [Methanobacteriaceae archaeon]MDD4593640.1 dTDP-4-dehydrorhamnose reductase [Methanobacteriaceae archaeon]
MRILITGASGMLGHDLQRTLKNHELILYNSKNLDITNKNLVSEKINEMKPDILINSAAYTNVDDCETNYEEAHKVNALGPKNLATVCKDLKIPLVHISTDYVFDGKKTEPLKENDNLGPQTAYGKTKLEGEQFIQKILDEYFIIRTAWLYGCDGNNFVKTMLNLSKSHNEINVVNDQIGSPTFTYDLAKGISEIIKTDKYGVYHLTNSGSCSWYEFSKEIFKLANINVKVTPVTTEEFPRPAPRPKYSVLSNDKWIKQGFKPLRNYKEALKEYLLTC